MGQSADYNLEPWHLTGCAIPRTRRSPAMSGTVPPATAQARARVASLSRSRAADDPAMVDARRELAEARIMDTAARILAEAPPLTAAQRDRLAAIFRNGGGQS